MKENPQLRRLSGGWCVMNAASDSRIRYRVKTKQTLRRVRASVGGARKLVIFFQKRGKEAELSSLIREPLTGAALCRWEESSAWVDEETKEQVEPARLSTYLFMIFFFLFFFSLARSVTSLTHTVSSALPNAGESSFFGRRQLLPTALRAWLISLDISSRYLERCPLVLSYTTTHKLQTNTHTQPFFPSRNHYRPWDVALQKEFSENICQF